MSSDRANIMTSGMQTPITIAVIAGARPQFMKVAALQRAVLKWNTQNTQPMRQVKAIYINSGQHYDSQLSTTFFEELEIHFDIDLTNTYESRRPIDMLGNMIINLYDAFDQINSPVHWVIVVGDTNTTMAGAIAAAKRKLPLAHIEAGVRLGTLDNTEEQNRVVTERLSTVLFLTSKQDGQNLLREGISRHTVWSGDLIYDLVKDVMPDLPAGYGPDTPDKYVLATLHREETVQSDETMFNIMTALNSYQERVVFVCHPRTCQRLSELQLDNLDNFIYINGLSYKEMLSAIKGSSFVVTDSGGVQRESYYLGKRCLIQQEQAFWPSLVQAGINRTIGSSEDSIRAGFAWMKTALTTDELPSCTDLGDGNAGLTILRTLVDLTHSC